MDLTDLLGHERNTRTDRLHINPPQPLGDTVNSSRNLFSTLRLYVTGIIGLWAVMDSWLSWECLCEHELCEECSVLPPAPSWLYDSVVPYLSTYQNHISNPAVCVLDKL